ncbi:hypothetical protein TBLA_0B00690 [Henningerozyma blattae CBS 6284]|uniref:Glycosyltransferase family 91 protein n=1 Tax=Henningerozyma blattae (strain ATCC 34711 / CBS 6284 / DSM 70876 / NBRC 10599 / NRRL Y-10934 / UCD 77-7) TaxID=1071380 RepID=I2GXR0_HENB6|nr:hypothetical protein TBLA_0B00690 [Tetrapisispora blattae CBS 6284]CCH58912.1 hypothetical protein TBLA_0B00690 [Tetrapisispora blattae CBS 6284]
MSLYDPNSRQNIQPFELETDSEASDSEFELDEFSILFSSKLSDITNKSKNILEKLCEILSFQNVKYFWGKIYIISLETINVKIKNLILLQILIIVLIFTPLNLSQNKENGLIFLNQSSLDNVLIKSKNQLTNIDLTNIVNQRSISDFPLSKELMKDSSYGTYKFSGIIFNPKSSNLSIEQNHKSDTKDIECKYLEYTSEIFVSKKSITLGEKLGPIRKHLLSQDKDEIDKFIAKQITKKEEKGLSNDAIAKKNWFMFGSSSVWMESEQCFLTVSRLMYSPDGSKKVPNISLIRAQTFDKNWKEIKGKRIPILETAIPIEDQTILNNLDYNCCKESDLNYEECLKNKNTRQELIDKYYVTYPTVYKFPMLEKKVYMGPEDPKIILKKTGNIEEPLIVFNMATTHARRMHVFSPHREINRIVELNFKGIRGMEKNWAPFLTSKDLEPVTGSRGTIHFVYNYEPLEILKCSLDDGYCEKEYFSSKHSKRSNKSNFGHIRGGTQFVQLPSAIPNLKDKQIFVGLAKTHLNDCGCGSRFYRPILDIIVEEKGTYYHELMVPSMDFNIKVLNWDLDSDKCKFYNILSPNSIAFWDIIRQDPKTKNFEDVLVFTFSEADELSKVINIKGLLNYILQMYAKNDISESKTVSANNDIELQNSMKCVRSYSQNSCKKYGELYAQ